MRNFLKSKIFTSIILVSAVALIIIGVTKGQAIDVLNKAIRICLECVGIG